MDWQAVTSVLVSVAGVIVALILVYLVRKDWPIPKITRIMMWAMIWAIGGAIVGLADDEVEITEGILLGALWGTLLAVIGLSGWSLRKNK
jgi:hypothetical protein